MAKRRATGGSAQLELPLEVAAEPPPRPEPEHPPGEPQGKRPWIWRYCKLNPEADHRSEKPGREGLLYDCCCPPAGCLVGFAPDWREWPGYRNRRNGERREQ